MSFLLATARKDLRRRARDPISLGIWVGIPALIALLLGAINTGDGGPPSARVLLADRDSSVASRLLAGAAGSERSPVRIEEVSPAEGRSRMEEGEASALVVVPAGFGRALLEGPPEEEDAPEITVVTNPGQRFLPRVAVEGVRTLSEAAFYARQLLGDPLSEIAAASGEDAPLADARVAGIASRINARIRGMEGVALPPVLRLSVETRGGGGDGVGFGRLLLPGIVFMALLLLGEGLAGDLWEEQKTGALSRWRSSPHPVATVLAGKLLAGAVVAAAVAAVGFGTGAILLDVAPARLPLAVAWSAGAVTCMVPLFYLLHLSASGQRGGNLVSNMVLFPLLMLGGSFFPFEAMPGWMASVGVWLPNGRAVAVLRDLLAGGADGTEVAATAGALLLIGLLGFVATARWIPRRFGAGGSEGAP